MKKIFVILALIFLVIPASALTISDYKVPNSVNLSTVLTVDGQVIPAQEKIWCSIRIYDLDTNNFVKRLTDESTTSGGVFSSSYLVISEPTFWRTSDYNVITDCNGAIASSVFNVAQRLPPDNFFIGELFYIGDNSFTWLIILFGIVIAVLFISLIVHVILESWKR